MTVLVAGFQATDAPSDSEINRSGTSVVPLISWAGCGSVCGCPLTVATSAPSGRIIAVSPFLPVHGLRGLVELDSRAQGLKDAPHGNQC